MKYKAISFLLLSLFLLNCSTKKTTHSFSNYEIKLDTLTMFDKNRNRKIPVAFYHPEKGIKNQQVVIFNHGYGANKGGDYFVYSYLTEKLAYSGYFVVSIQHELPTDELIPTDGKPQIVRMPFWERGAGNILFVLNELKKSKPELDYQHITLIGHSNGGDMTALFANKHPDLVYKIITMDNRRMYLPRTSTPIVYTLRSNDYPADEGVLPTKEEQEKYHITVQSTNINHGKMDDKGSDDDKQTLSDLIIKYLNEN
ncbi:alpha/beta fold hydrolase [Chryseobacterium sp. SIMBA_038]|uniref:alpha/beta fold hydrolase n=1 Tax=Chryseobacterium sp. SIMBA_038 TaxID=3085780 RepID=UPI00397D9020